MADDIFLTIGVETKGILTAIKTTETLKNNIEKLIKARDRNQINDAQLNASLEKLAKNSGAYGKQVDGVRKSIEAANKAQKEAIAAAKQAKEEDKAFAQARREAIAINKEFDRQKKQEAAETARAAAEEERLKIKFVEGHLAMQIYSREMNDLAVARKADIITKEQQIAATARLNQEMTAGTGVFSGYGVNAQAMTKKNNQLGVATQQLGYQVGDFFVQIQSGTNPMVAFGQQATQLVGVLPLVAAQLGLTTAAATTLAAVLGIAIPIFTAVGAVLLTMYMNSEDVNKSSENSVDVFQRLTEATKQLYTERMKLTDPSFDENLEGTQDELKRLTDAYEATRQKAEELNRIQSLGGRAAASVSQIIEASQAAREAADAAVREAKAKLEAYQQEVGLAEARRLNNARIDAQNEQGIRDLEAKRALGISILSTIVEESRKRAEIARDIGQAYLDTLGIAGANVSSGVDRAAEAARILATNLGISLSAAQSMVNLAANALPMTMAPSDPLGFARNEIGFINPDRLLPPVPSVGISSGGGGGGSAPSDPLADLMKRIELEKELLGTSEAYQEVLQAIQGSDKKYSDAAIQGAVARLEAINKEKEALQQMESLQQSIAETIGDGFMSMVDGTKTVKDAFKDMARDIIKQLYEVLVVQRLVNGVKGILGGSFANGGAFSAGKQIQAYANGGVVGGPTYFPMSGGKTGLMGEAGPEAIMPLKRGRGGKLGVSVEGNSGSVNVVNNINVTGGSDPAAIRAEVAKLMPQITSATKSAVIDARRRGGQMKAAFQ